MFHIGIVNQATVKFGDLNQIVQALQLQITAHFYPHWGINAKLAIFPKPEKNWWNIYITDNADQAGALGYHDETDDGLPQGFVFAKTSLDNGKSVSSVLSHEILETLPDPTASMAVQVAEDEFWAYEVCDAVEELSYQISGVEVSDFVLPSWFNPYLSLPQHGGSFDYLGQVRKPLTLAKGGYMPVYKGGKWTQIFGSEEKEKRFSLVGKTRMPLRGKKFPVKRPPAITKPTLTPQPNK